MNTLLNNWKIRMHKYRQEADEAESPVERVKAINKFLTLRDCIKEVEAKLKVIPKEKLCDEMCCRNEATHIAYTDHIYSCDDHKL